MIDIWWPFWIMQIRCFPIMGFLRTFSMVFWGPHRNSLWQNKLCYNLFQVKPYFAWTSSVCLFAPHLVLASFLTIFNRRLAFAAVFSMCFLIESFGSSCRPRYCGASSFCISSPPYLIFTLFSTLYLLEKMVYTVLFVLSFSFHRLQYVHRLPLQVMAWL